MWVGGGPHHCEMSVRRQWAAMCAEACVGPARFTRTHTRRMRVVALRGMGAVVQPTVACAPVGSAGQYCVARRVAILAEQAAPGAPRCVKEGLVELFVACIPDPLGPLLVPLLFLCNVFWLAIEEP